MKNMKPAPSVLWEQFIAFIMRQHQYRVICHDASPFSAWHNCAIGDFAREIGKNPKRVAIDLKNDLEDHDPTEDDYAAVYEFLNQSVPGLYGTLQWIIVHGAAKDYLDYEIDKFS